MYQDLLEMRVKSSRPPQPPFDEKMIASPADFIVARDGRAFDNRAERARRTDPHYQSIVWREWSRQRKASGAEARDHIIAALVFLLALIVIGALAGG